MLLFEAKNEIDERIKHYEHSDLRQECKEYAEALRIASKSIEAQIRLSELLNEFLDGIKETDNFSTSLCYEMLSTIRFDAKFDEDGIYINDEILENRNVKGKE